MTMYTQAVRDPLSGYIFHIETPVLLKKRVYSWHPLYIEPFDLVYSEAKKILLSREKFHSLPEKQLIFGVLLYKLSETEIIQIRQFKTLKVSYPFFDRHDLLSKLFFLLPKIVFGTTKLLNALPRFRITGNDIEYLEYWVDRCIKIISDRDRVTEAQGFDEKLQPYLQVWDKWKLYSSNKDKLPPKVLHYVATVTAMSPDSLVEWKEFFTLSSGQLYLINKAKSQEAFKLFWSLLSCIDHIECSDYQNTLTFATVKWLKKKVEEWVSWEPSFFDISLDYKLQAPKKEAWENATKFWIQEAEQHKEEAKERQALADSVRERLQRIKAEKMMRDKKPSATSQFTISTPDSQSKLSELLNKQDDKRKDNESL